MAGTVAVAVRQAAVARPAVSAASAVRGVRECMAARYGERVTEGGRGKKLAGRCRSGAFPFDARVGLRRTGWGFDVPVKLRHTGWSFDAPVELRHTGGASTHRWSTGHEEETWDSC
ncbi:hypothetical protein GCM10010240_41590 [Streptomyces griseoviridis]|nr:hypothetical protein GCM10010240_41590 [Streptomyces griseoviridis]